MFFRFHTLGTNVLEAALMKKRFFALFLLFPSSLQAVRPDRKQTLTLTPFAWKRFAPMPQVTP